MILTQLATKYTLSEVKVDDCASLEQQLISDTDRSKIIRTKIEDLTTYFENEDSNSTSLSLPSLVRTGPSCVNI